MYRDIILRIPEETSAISVTVLSESNDGFMSTRMMTCECTIIDDDTAGFDVNENRQLIKVNNKLIPKPIEE